jgi:phage terminase large subunit-like protein
MKSALVAYRVAQALTKDPTLKVLYISSTANLAHKQLKFIKDIFTSDRFQLLWPEHVHKEEAKRELWTQREIALDHPLRKEWAIRDPSIFTAGLTTNIVGLHADIIVMDDVVVYNNAYTEETREKTLQQFAYLSSIAGAEPRVWVVGTRYHPNDLYDTMLSMEITDHDELGNVTGTRQLYDHREWPVESIGDGTGEFIWPRQKGHDGKWFGFDAGILAEKRSNYKGNITHYRAQYYNDPNDVDSSPIDRGTFQYYERNFITEQNSRWFFKGTPLNVVAAVDFAFTIGKKSDFTAIVVVGADGRGNYYVLDIDRFRSEHPSEYFKRIIKLYEKWGFRKIRAEVNVAQQALIRDFQENYIKKLGLSLSVDEARPMRYQGSKEERILAVLEPKYANKQIWHYTGGHCQTLEEELIYQNPAHDDVKDALAAALDFVTTPRNQIRQVKEMSQPFEYHNRWGGVA